MELQPTQAETQQQTNAASPHPRSAPRSLNRCSARNRSGRQCRLAVQDPSLGLCPRHAAEKDTDPDTADVSTDLFPDLKPLETPDEVNDLLSRLVLLIAQGRISTRRASVISYSSSLILYGLTVNDKLIVARQPLIFDWTKDPRLASSSNANPRETNPEDPVSSHAKTHADGSASSAAGATVAPTTPLEALRTYEQLRT